MEFLVGSAALLAFLISIIGMQGRLRKERVKGQQIGWLSDQSNFWDEDLNKNLWERLIMPVLAKVRMRMKKSGKRKIKSGVKKKSSATRLENDLRLAGLSLGASEYTFLRIAVTVAILIAGFFIATQVSRDITLQFLVVLVAVTFAVAVPTFFLRMRIKGRQQAIQNQMPNVMDVLSVSIEAGLGFDAALLKVIERFDGPLIDELALVYREVQMGMPRRESLKALTKRSNVPELQTFTSAIIQSEQYGTPIKNVLRQQSVQLRLGRKQAAQEKGMKAPVRILLPMVLFIFPVIFIVLLGPTVITAIGELT